MMEKLKVTLADDSSADEESRTADKSLLRILTNKKKVEKQTQKSMKQLADVFRDTQHNTVTKLSLCNAYAFGELIKELCKKKLEGASTLCPIIKAYTQNAS